MPAEMLTNERRAGPPIPDVSAPEDVLYEWARNHLERIRRLKLHVTAFVLGMIVLTPIWALTEWQSNGGFERWSDNSQPGDWEPWILYIGVAWGLWVAFVALRVYLDRPVTEADVQREIQRVQARR